MAAITAYAQLTLMEAMKREGFDDLAASLGELAQMNARDLQQAIPGIQTWHWVVLPHGWLRYSVNLKLGRADRGAGQDLRGAFADRRAASPGGR